ncbi:MAG: hypothetical protein OXI61_04150 [Candidatus Poribacteria bacterium]|nr:hypothetical protein [Candidatus Poribacteria bacterium]
MPNEHIDANIDKIISAAIGVGISQDIAMPRALASSLKSVNQRLDCPSLLYK